MASAPPDPPESIIVGQFAGIRNNVSEERLKVGELSAAVNVDIDDAGQLRRRRGYTKVDTAVYHSAANIGDRCVAVKDGVLGFLNPDYSLEPLDANIGSEALGYAAVGSSIYYSSRVAAGKIVDGVRQDWAAEVSAGRWVSPVILPTDTLGAVAGRMLGAPPMATELEHYKGRIYLATGRFLWFTELYLYDLVDKNRNVLQFEHDITMIRAVDDGFYVGTTKQLFFLQGTAAKGLQRTPVLDSPVVKGSSVTAPTSVVHPQARDRPIPESTVPVFLTEDGVCVGLNSGEVYNLTRGRVAFPAAASAAALYREDQGATAYTAVMDSAGGSSANMRIGDYVDAEIVRASQGG